MDTNKPSIQLLLKYFPDLTIRQQEQFARLGSLYTDWNEKINVISRKDIDALYEHHVLHSLSIAKMVQFTSGSRILDVGTGGGFPGIPLAILFPDSQFTLIDSIGKKIKVATDVAAQIGLRNVKAFHLNAKEEKGHYDFVISRAVMQAAELMKITIKNVERNQRNSIDNGIICLKGGTLEEEAASLRRGYQIIDISDYFEETFFETKKILYIPIIK